MTPVEKYAVRHPFSEQQEDALKKSLVMAAFAEGAKIECSHYGDLGPGPWVPVSTPSWNWDDYDYRVAPKPVPSEILVAVRDDNGQPTGQIVQVPTDGEARFYTPFGVTLKRYREVIE